MTGAARRSYRTDMSGLWRPHAPGHSVGRPLIPSLTSSDPVPHRCRWEARITGSPNTGSTEPTIAPDGSGTGQSFLAWDARGDLSLRLRRRIAEQEVTSAATLTMKPETAKSGTPTWNTFLGVCGRPAGRGMGAVGTSTGG